MLRENISVFPVRLAKQMPKSGGVDGLVFLIGWASGLSLVGFVMLVRGLFELLVVWYCLERVAVGLR